MENENEKIMGMARHSVSFLVPRPTETEQAELEESILSDGLQDPITVIRVDGKTLVVDGWTRHTICARHGIAGKYVPTEDPVGVVVRKNLRRRNLTQAQKAEAEWAVEEYLRGNEPGYKPRTERELAADAEVSHTTINRASQKRRGLEPETPPVPSRTERLQAELDAALDRIDELNNEVSNLNERVGYLREVEEGIPVRDTKAWEAAQNALKLLRDEKSGLQRENRKLAKENRLLRDFADKVENLFPDIAEGIWKGDKK